MRFQSGFNGVTWFQQNNDCLTTVDENGKVHEILNKFPILNGSVCLPVCVSVCLWMAGDTKEERKQLVGVCLTVSLRQSVCLDCYAFCTL